jgi:hypothetical protein
MSTTSSQVLNILILSEKSVGKPTFINALVNYLTFESLDKALESDHVQYATSALFDWQYLEGNDYVTKDIHMRRSSAFTIAKPTMNDRGDGAKGTSFLQRTEIYPIDVHRTSARGGLTTQVRLIDTPTIGDDQNSTTNKDNMDCIIQALGAVDELHGILILLNSYCNKDKVTFMVNFCLKELVIHLPRDTAKNIVFGFTQARYTSFRPGRPYTLLSEMLKNKPFTDIRLEPQLAYCLDAEAFQFLAAHDQGVPIDAMGDIQDFRTNWAKSSSEVFRLLDHCEQSFLRMRRLDQTRNSARILAKPMVCYCCVCQKDQATHAECNLTLGRYHSDDQRQYRITRCF